MSDAVILRGMRFDALIGILPHEHESAQPLEVDLIAWLAAPISTSEQDAEKHVVDYRVLYDMVASEVVGRHNGYIEHLAARIAERALRDVRIARVELAIRKPNVELGGPLQAAEVRVERIRR